MSDLAPSWLSRPQRRRVDRELQKLLSEDTCSVCGSRLRHNSRTASGFDGHGNVVVAGECCISAVVVPFGFGLYIDRQYDFLSPRKSSVVEPTGEQALDAIAAYQKVIAATDKQVGTIERRGGSGRAPKVSVLDAPWKDDDRAWFERNPSRAHRARMPFPGELDEVVAKAPAGHALIMLVRQVEPGSRLKANFYFNASLLPVPDDEAIAHAFFEVAMGPSQYRPTARRAGSWSKNIGGRPMDNMQPDRAQLEIFIEAMFRHATQGFTSLRSFLEGNSAKPFRISTTKITGGLTFLTDCAEDDAYRAANYPKPVVFCPPLATFVDEAHARERDIVEGVALSVECDVRPREARAKLEALLGLATFVVRSGGTWTDPATGEIEDKLHLHWRLQIPARGDALPKLKQARDLAARLVGGDPSNKPVCHPIWWPGSWHRKGEPIMCSIDTASTYSEIDLADALGKLTAACPEEPKQKVNAKDCSGDSADWDTLLKNILIGESYHGALVPLAAKLLVAGMKDSACVNFLRGIMVNVTAPHDERWQARFDDIDRTVSTARDKFGAEPSSEAIDPVDLWGFFDPPMLPEGLLPSVIEEFAREEAETMGADPRRACHGGAHGLCGRTAGSRGAPGQEAQSALEGVGKTVDGRGRRRQHQENAGDQPGDDGNPEGRLGSGANARGGNGGVEPVDRRGAEEGQAAGVYTPGDRGYHDRGDARGGQRQSRRRVEVARRARRVLRLDGALQQPCRQFEPGVLPAGLQRRAVCARSRRARAVPF
jgi:hypothetical protein